MWATCSAWPAGLCKIRSSAGFVSDVLPATLQKYGLDQPQLKVTFASYASENTAGDRRRRGGTAGDHPL